MPATDPTPPAAERLLVVPWSDPVLDAVGFDPRTAYVERFWLPLLGPTSTWLLRRLAAVFDDAPDGFDLPLGDVARSIGVGSRNGRNSPVGRALQRCVRFGLAREEDHGVLAVRRRLPALTHTQTQSLAPPIRSQHRHWQRQRQQQTPITTIGIDRATLLARSLQAVGANDAEIEDQLRRWGFDDTTARRALRDTVSTPATLDERIS